MKGFGPIGAELVKTTAKAVLPERTRQWLRSRQQKVQARRLFQRHLRPTDVFLVGHPKSGNTWLTYMLGIAMRKSFNHKQITLANVQEFYPAIHDRDGEIASYAHLPNPRMFRNEAPIYGELYPKTVYIMRDPRSVLVSYYHHALHDLGEYEWTMDAYIEEMLTYGCINRLEPFLVRWDKHVSYWLERAEKQPVKFVKYEEMKRDRGRVLDDVIKFIGYPCDAEDMALAVKEGSFENMRKNEETYGAEPYSGTKGERGYFVRNGKVDGWKKELPAALTGRIEREFAATMRRVGYMPESI
jgi:Sulfotransferase domain